MDGIFGLTLFQSVLLFLTLIGTPANLYIEYSKTMYPLLDRRKSIKKTAFLTIVAACCWYSYAVTSGNWFFILSTGMNVCFQLSIRILKIVQANKQNHEYMKISPKMVWDFAGNDY